MRLLMSLALALGLLAATPLPAQEEAAPEPPPIATRDVAPDAVLAERLRAILKGLGQSQVVVNVEAGVVTLRGEVAGPGLVAEMVDIAGRLEGVVAVRSEVTEAGALAEQLDPALSRFAARLEQALARLPLLLVALTSFALILALGYLVSRARFWDRLGPNRFIAGIYRQGVRILFGLAGLVIALDLLGATALLGTILGAAGIIGLALGFAVRDTVENFVASVMLSLRQPFRPNDLVEIEGDTGRVIRLTSRATTLLSLDGNHIRIPNATVFKSRIVNYSRNASRRFVFDIGIDPEADLEATRRLAQETLAGTPFVLDMPEALVWIENITEAGAILRVTGWIDQVATGYVTARGDAIRLVKDAIEAAGVSIPDTTYRIRVEGAAALATLTATDADAEPPAPPRRSKPAEAPMPHHSEEKALIAMVAAEREGEREGEGDLLRKDAPQE